MPSSKHSVFLCSPTLLLSPPCKALMLNSKKMEIPGSKRKHSQKRTLPPRRGQIKIRIIKGLVKSLGSMAGGRARKPNKYGGFLSSSSQTPAETPSGYCSDAQSDRS